MPVTEVRKLINAFDNDKTSFTYPPFISEDLRKIVELPEDTNEGTKNKREKQMDHLKNEFNVQINELKEQMDKQNQQMEKLLNGIIKGLKIDIKDEIEEKETKKIEEKETKKIEGNEIEEKETKKIEGNEIEEKETKKIEEKENKEIEGDIIEVIE